MKEQQAGLWLGIGFILAGLHNRISRDGVALCMELIMWLFLPLMLVSVVLYIAMTYKHKDGGGN